MLPTFAMYDTDGAQILVTDWTHYRGAHCVMEWQGRTLLGAIAGAFVREFPFPATMLEVRHFNGEPWPITPHVAAVRVLVRDYDERSAD